MSVFNMSKDFISGLIQLYRSFPCLWHSKHEDYKNKDVKNAAYQKLLAHGKRFDKDCTVHDIRHKILNLRTTTRREFRKVEAAKLINKVHVPNLWYYKLFEFTLLENELPPDESEDVEVVLENIKKYETRASPSKTSNSDKQEDDLEYFIEMDSESSQDLQVFTAPINFSQSEVKKRKSSGNIENEYFTEANGRNLGEYEAVTIGWTAKLRKLNDRQKVLAENLINQVLMRGYFDELTRTTELRERT